MNTQYDKSKLWERLLATNNMLPFSIGLRRAWSNRFRLALMGGMLGYGKDIEF
jgi:hypothetical protein